MIKDPLAIFKEIMSAWQEMSQRRVLGHDLQLERTKVYFIAMEERCKNIPFLHESARDHGVEIQRSIDFQKPREGKTDEDIKRTIIISENDNPYGRLLETEIADNILKSITPKMNDTVEQFAAFTLKILDNFVDTADDESKKKVLETFKNETVIKACNLDELRLSQKIHHPLRNLANHERNESIEQDLRDYLASPVEDAVSSEIFFHIMTRLPRHINEIYDTPPIKWRHAAEEYEAQVVESIRNRERPSDGFYSFAKGINFVHNMPNVPEVEDGRKYRRAVDRIVLDIDNVKETTENRLHQGESFAADVSGHTMGMLFGADEANKQGYNIDPKYATLLLGAMVVRNGCHTWGETISMFNHLSDALRFQKSVLGRHDLSPEEKGKIGENYEKWAKLLPAQRSTEESRARDKEVNHELSEARENLIGLLQKEHFVSNLSSFFSQFDNDRETKELLDESTDIGIKRIIDQFRKHSIYSPLKDPDFYQRDYAVGRPRMGVVVQDDAQEKTKSLKRSGEDLLGKPRKIAKMQGPSSRTRSATQPIAQRTRLRTVQQALPADQQANVLFRAANYKGKGPEPKGR